MDRIATEAFSPIHDIAHQSRLLRESLNSEKRRVGFFLGAGCPLGIYDKAGQASMKLIPDILGLTQTVAASLGDERKKECWKLLTEACSSSGIKEPNVENVLTQIRTICAIRGGGIVHGMSTEELSLLDAEICGQIANRVGANLPEYICSYNRFAAWIRHIERAEPVELFTSNYDLLLEEALEAYQVPYFDGFVGSREPFFDLLSLEVDAIPSRWVRLWKVHGSINWIKRTDGSVYRKQPATPEERLLIYPSHLKYAQSRRMPYLGLLDRFRAFFQVNHSVLVVCGYSFADDHLNEILFDGLRSNRTVHCYGLMYGRLSECAIAIQHASRHPNLTLLCSDGAAAGTRIGCYRVLEQDPPEHSGYVKLDDGSGRSLLGDFHHFCEYLETQFGVRNGY